MKTFNNRVENLIKSYDFTQENNPNENFKCFKKQTKFGKLNILLEETKSNIYSVYMKFDNLINRERFFELFDTSDFNPNSLKWNIHNADKEMALNELESRLENI